MTFWDFLNLHKTKITGILLVASQFLQQSPKLVTLLSPTTFDIVDICLGLTIVIIGFLNSNAARS